jgi:uncharacterized protein
LMKKIELRHKTVAITGASSGIGRALSVEFAREGAHLVLGCLPSERRVLEEHAAGLRKNFGVRVSALPVDLSVDSGPARFRAGARKAAGEIDILVNNAGLMAYGCFHELPIERQELMIRVNAIAYFKLMRLFIEDFIKVGGGAVLNVSSISAFQPTAHHAVYGAGKAFVQNLSEAVREEVRGTGVTVMTLNPPYTDTPLLKGEDFPGKLWWYAVGGLSSAEMVARKGVRALKRGRAVYVSDARSFFLHMVLQRALPRRFVAWLSWYVLLPRGKR